MRQPAREARRRRRGREDDGVEARVLALVGWDPRHQGAYGMAWWPHMPGINAADPVLGPWQGFCHSCPWEGEWCLSYVAADHDGEFHMQTAGHPA